MSNQNKQQKYINKVNRILASLDFKQLDCSCNGYDKDYAGLSCRRFIKRLFLCIKRTIWTGASMNLLSCPL